MGIKISAFTLQGVAKQDFRGQTRGTDTALFEERRSLFESRLNSEIRTRKR